MCHDNKEWLKIWRGIDKSVHNWHEEFDEFWHNMKGNYIPVTIR